MSLLKKVFSDSAITGIRLIITTLRGLILIPIITNLLGAGSYGIWTTVLAFTSLIKSTGSLHLHGALIRYGVRDEGKEQTYVDILTFIVVAASLLSILVGISAWYVDISVFLEGEIDDEVGLIIASCLLIFASMLWDINLNFFRSKGRVKFYDVLRIAKLILEAGGLIFIFFVGGGIIEGIAFLGASSLILSIILFAIIVKSVVLPQPTMRRYIIYFRYSIPMVPRIVSDQILTNGDKFLVLYFLNPAAVGIYAVAYAVSTLLVKFTSIFNPTLYPTIAHAWDTGKLDEITTLYKHILRGYFILAIPALVGLSLLAEPLLTILSTVDIAKEGAILVPILLFGFLMKGAHNPLTYILTSAERTSRIALVIIFGTSLNLVLNVMLIPQFGLFGAAFATAISASSILLLMYYFANKVVSVPLPFQSIANSIVAAGIMGSVLSFLPIHDILLEMILLPPIGMIIYFVALYSLGEFAPREIKWLSEKGTYIRTRISNFNNQDQT